MDGGPETPNRDAGKRRAIGALRGRGRSDIRQQPAGTADRRGDGRRTVTRRDGPESTGTLKVSLGEESTTQMEIAPGFVINLIMAALIVLSTLALICIANQPAALRHLSAWAQMRGMYLEQRSRLHAKTRRLQAARERELAEEVQIVAKLERDIDSAIAAGVRDAEASAAAAQPQQQQTAAAGKGRIQ